MKAFFFILLSFSLFASEEKIPDCGNKKIQFKDYPVKEILTDVPKELNLKSVKEKKLHFFLGLKPRKYKSPNFAGHFRTVRGGCGTMCTTYVVIDLKDGEPYDLGVSASLSFRFKKDSSLVIVDPEDVVEKWMENRDVERVNQTTYYNFVNNQMIPVCVRKYQKPKK